MNFMCPVSLSVTHTLIWTDLSGISTKYCLELRLGKKAGEDVPTREEFKRPCLETLKTKKDTMLLEHHMGCSHMTFGP